jgi:CRISPR-associated protein Csm4
LNWYRVKFKLKSWVASAWQSDTIFGHLCWGMRYLQGVEKLQDFLQAYQREQPPLILSNGFPGDFLPVPLRPVLSFDASLPLEEQKLAYDKIKASKKIRYLSLADFNRVLAGEKAEMKNKPPTEFQRVTVKNQLNRITDTTGQEGNLYNFEEQYCAEISIYLKVEDSFVKQAQELFSYIATSGYGKRKSIGYGQIEDYTFESFAGFSSPASPDGYVSLSNFVPSQTDPVKGSWRTITKYGKMGEEYSLEDHVFKRPLIMLEAGATFHDSPVRDFYGCLVKNLNPSYPEAVQYAFALPVPMSLPGK